MDKGNANCKKIEEFIKANEYDYVVEDVLREYKKKINGFYVSYTMDICIKNCENEIQELLAQVC